MSKVQGRRDFMKLAGGGLATVATSSFNNVLQAQTESRNLAPVLKTPIQSPDVVDFQLRQYLMKRVPKLDPPATAEQWNTEAKRLRKDTLDIILRGWPPEWVNAPLKVEDLGLIPTGREYRLRKLRYEIIPGLQSTALLYEPERVNGKVPATLNLNGHTPQGKGAEYKQKRCINNALRGMYALSLEWFFCGELGVPENTHWFGAHIDLAGAHGVGLFYLAMRKGVDYLCQHPNVDAKRIGVTGLSGGGWQTIVLSSLDERVAAAAPVSGYFPMVGAVERLDDVGDFEYNPTDMRTEVEYTTLTAMMAPRPTLLMYATEDEWVGRAQVMKPELYDPVKPFFKLYGKEDCFYFHENSDPGTHNYQLDNRQQSYAFFGKHFGIPGIEQEILVDPEIRSCEELVVGLPNDNLTLLGTAKKLAAMSKREALPSSAASQETWTKTAREKLRQLLRYRPVELRRRWAVSSTKHLGFSAISYRLEMNDDLSATAVWIKTNTTGDDAPATLVLDDRGFNSIDEKVVSPAENPPRQSECRNNPLAFHANRGQQVWAVNLLFTGDASPEQQEPTEWGAGTLHTLLLHSIGERPLGMRVAQLVALARWLQASRGVKQLSIDSTGIRNQVVALAAAALEPGLFSGVLIRDGMKSLNHLLDKPVTYQQAPELFCLGLYKEFDIDSLAALARPAKVIQDYMSAKAC